MSRPIVTLLREYQWIHLSLGLIGNLCFVIGSVCFLYQDLKTAGTWLFIAGSSGMLIGALGRAAAKLTWDLSPAIRHEAKQTR